MWKPRPLMNRQRGGETRGQGDKGTRGVIDKESLISLSLRLPLSLSPCLLVSHWGNLDESDGVYSAPDLFVVAVVIRAEPAVAAAGRFQVSERFRQFPSEIGVHVRAPRIRIIRVSRKVEDRLPEGRRAVHHGPAQLVPEQPGDL